MEIITIEQYNEYENFVSTHPQSCFTQSIKWRKIKDNWGFEGIVSRDEHGNIEGACSVLTFFVKKTGTTFLYSPRGPVCDLNNRKVLADLKKGMDVLAEKYNAHTIKLDPDISIANTDFLNTMKELGFEHKTGGNNFGTIQARFNYRLYLNGRNEEEIFMNLTQKTRYNIRVAQKKGVEIRVVDEGYLEEFVRIMKVTGERDGFNVRPIEYFQRMLEEMGDNVRLYMAFYEDKPISGAITTNYAGKTCYVYGASDNVYRNVMPNYLIQWEMIRWAIETGCKVYDFQGVSGDLDESNPLYGLYRFKKGFNGDLDELAGEFDCVYNREAFDQT